VAATVSDEQEDRRRRTRSTLDAFGTEFVLQVDRRGALVAADRSVTLGYDRDEQAGRHIAELIHPDDLLRVYEVIEQARSTVGYYERFAVRGRHKSGDWHDLDVTVVDAASRDPGLEGALIRVRDLTAAGEVATASDRALVPDAALEEPPHPGEQGESSRFLSLADALPLGILSADARSWVVFANDAACELFGRPLEGLHGSGWLEAVHPEDRPEVRAALDAAMQGGRWREAMFRVDASHPTRWAQARFLPLGQGRRTGWLATVEDVTERLLQQSELAHQATHDGLTSLPNRALLEDRLDQACHRVRREGSSLSVLFTDLDDFKAVNDEYGHAAGDVVLIEVGRRLRSVVREVDTVARLGGDEFVIVCEGTDEAEAAALVDRLEAEVGRPIHLPEGSVRVGISIGSVTSSARDVEVAELLGHADHAMYRVKRLHRERRDEA
jgi:diguanylate cyclase (GGDEF)-like protein/PAS domain S-box-containing protein